MQEITYVFTDDKSAAAPETESKQPYMQLDPEETNRSYMQLDPVQTNPTPEPVRISPSVESSSRQDNRQPKEHKKPEDQPSALGDVPQFPKSEAIQATRSQSPTDDLGQRWDDLPHQLKSRVVPRMTRSGGVTLKAIGKSQSQDSGAKSGSAAKRKGSGSGAWGVQSGVSGLAPIDDVEDGWTTVVSQWAIEILNV